MDRPIGVIDSGVGGLTVAQELMRQLPKEKLIYLGDTKRCPYGPRTKEEVQQFTWDMVHYLLEKDIKLLVVACNTATAFTIKDLKEKLTIPVIGVIQPGARAAIKTTKNKRIGIIGTEGTIRSGAYKKALQAINSTIHVQSHACPSLVPIVEQGIVTSEEATHIVRESLQPIKEANRIDTLILGCTHYPLLKDVIQTVIGKHVSIVSSSEETARETSVVLDIHHLLYVGDRIPKHQFFTTGDLQTFTDLATNIFKNDRQLLSFITFATPTPESEG